MDLLQREGMYPVPPQAPETMGVEFSGVVESLGSGASDFKVGDEVLGLAYGGEFLFSLLLDLLIDLCVDEGRCLCGVRCRFNQDAGAQAGAVVVGRSCGSARGIFSHLFHN